MKSKQDQPFGAKPNYIYATISVALILFLIGLFSAALLRGDLWLKEYQENVDILLEISEGTDEAGIQELVDYLSGREYVLARSVSFISKDEGLALLEEDFGADFAALEFPNPLYNVITFNLPADYLRPDSLSLIRQELKALAGVHDLYYQDVLLEQLAGNMSRARRVILFLSVFLLFLAYHLIHNTFRLALYANRMLIKNMEMVGATWSFISRPFIRKALGYGLLSGILASGMLVLARYLLLSYFPEENSRNFSIQMALIAGGLMLLGAGTSALSTWIVVRRYLRMRMDDLY